MTEYWRDIEGYEGLYQVSNLGRVKSLKDCYGKDREKILKPRKDKYGYLTLSLCKNGVKKSFTVHRLVAQAFIHNPNPNHYTQVNHLDENRTNNKLSNLQWCTCQENLNYGNRVKNYIKTRGHKVRCIETGKVYNSLREAERDTGCAHTHISECVRGIAKQCNGLHWEYVE